jgi:Fe-S oxidoreductase
MAIAERAVTCPNDTTLETLLATPEGQQIMTCLQCGTCAGACPYGEYMEYPPRAVINMLWRGLLDEVIASGSLMRCVGCYACMSKCPRGIRLTDVLLPLVKEQTLANLKEMPGELQKSLENMARYGNPMGESPRKRTAWAAGAGVPVRVLAEKPGPVDILWFVECYPSFYPRGQATAKATARLFQALGLDFAILGHEEQCVGECGYLTWEPGLFEKLRDANLKVMRKRPFQRLVTGDPHAYNAFQNRYPLAEEGWKVEHTTILLAQYLDALKPKLTKRVEAKVAYHDNCCLGRGMGCFDEPRALLSAIPGVTLVEMAHNRKNSLCCGGGGGGMWLDTYYKSKGMDRLSERRVQEAVAAGANVLAVSCPLELFRFEDAVKTLGHDKQLVVRDVVELLAESLEG